jgi:hypothetical protein
MAIEDDHEADPVAHIVGAFRAGKAMTRKKLLQIVCECYDRALTEAGSTHLSDVISMR